MARARVAKSFPASSAIDRASYEAGTKVLDIFYAGGDRYSYFDVPPRDYRALMEAPSIGAFVNRRIKPFYRYSRE